MKRKTCIFVTVVWCLGAIVGSGHADSVGSLFNLDGTTLNLASDNDAQYLAIDLNADGSLDVGDVLRGVIDINTLNSTPANVGGLTGNSEWSAIFSLEVTAIAPPIPGGPPYAITFGPEAAMAGAAGWLATLDPTGPIAPVGTIIRFYEDPTPDDDFTTSLAVAFDTAGPSYVGGAVPTASAFWDLGFTGAGTPPGVGPAEGWVAGPSVAITPAAGVNPGSVIGTSNFAVSLLANYTGYGIVPQPLDPVTASILGWTAGTTADVIGSSAVRGALASTAAAGFHADSDASMTFLAVPLPVAVWPGMVMLGLVGVGRFRSWRRSNLAA